MKYKIKNIAILFLFTFFASNLFSQTDTENKKQESKVLVKMKNGESYSGTIKSQDKENIVLNTSNGEIKLISSNVKSIEEDNYNGKFAYANSHDTRYFFGPTAIPIKKRKGYYQNVLLTSNFANYGVTDNISLGGGFEFISLMFKQPIWFFTPKAGFKINDYIYAGGGFIMAGVASQGSASLGYGVFTFGNSETNLSLGAGYGYFDGTLADNPAFMIAGTHRLSNSISLLSENYILPSQETGGTNFFGIQGIRILTKKNAFDVGAIVIPGATIPIPFVGYAITF
jgi:small nuclear ribonucleoprotein (snRNP)-like protein